MTDDEIVKALENLQNHKWIFARAENGDFIRMGDVADLIKRLQAKNSNLTSDLTSLKTDLTSAKAEIERLKEKMDILESRWL